MAQSVLPITLDEKFTGQFISEDLGKLIQKIYTLRA